MIKFLNEDPNLDMHASKSSRPSLVELQLITGISQVNYDSHFHKHCEILLLERGKGNALIDGKSFDIEPNSLIIFNPRIPHKENYFCTDGDIVLWSLNITDYQHINFVNGEQDNLLPADIPPVLAISAADAKEYSSLMKKIKAEYREKLPKYKEVCEAIADELLLLILRQYHMRYHIQNHEIRLYERYRLCEGVYRRALRRIEHKHRRNLQTALYEPFVFFSYFQKRTQYFPFPLYYAKAHGEGAGTSLLHNPQYFGDRGSDRVRQRP